MAEHTMQRRTAPKPAQSVPIQPAAMAHGPRAAQLQAAQRNLAGKPNSAQGLAHLPPRAESPLQGVFTYKSTQYSGGGLPKSLPHGVKKKDAERLSQAIHDFGTLTNSGDFATAVRELDESAEANVGKVDVAGEHKAELIAPYLALLGHLAGEEKGTGGHLVTAMEAKWGDKLYVNGVRNDAAVWSCHWNVLKDPKKPCSEANAKFWPSKFSTMFPAAWGEDELRRQLEGSSPAQNGRELASGIVVEKSGGTFYPV